MLGSLVQERHGHTGESFSNSSIPAITFLKTKLNSLQISCEKVEDIHNTQLWTQEKSWNVVVNLSKRSAKNFRGQFTAHKKKDTLNIIVPLNLQTPIITHTVDVSRVIADSWENSSLFYQWINARETTSKKLCDG